MKIDKWYNITAKITCQLDSSACGIFILVYSELILVGCTPQEILSLMSFTTTNLHDDMVIRWRNIIADRLEHILNAVLNERLC